MSDKFTSLEIRLQWVPVSERLPPNDWIRLVVYVTAPRNQACKRSIQPARYSGGAWRFLGTNALTRKQENVTHWCNLPDPP